MGSMSQFLCPNLNFWSGITVKSGVPIRFEQFCSISVFVLFQCMARALYDNIAESPDELAFRRGDLLTVLEQNTGGSEGWWLCSLRGRQVRTQIKAFIKFKFKSSIGWMSDVLSP